jgi:protein TonB
MKWSMGLGVLMGFALASGAFAQAPASAPAMSAAASAVMHGMACAPPAMPMRAAEARAQGTSHLRFHVDETGKVTSAEIIRSSGQTSAHRLLDNAAMKALAQCPVQPARDANGRPVASDVDVSYTWKLE